VSITTYEDLILDPNAKKIALAEIEPKELITTWTNHTGNIYYSEIGSIHVITFSEDGTELTEVGSIAAISAGEWFYDDSTGRIYTELTGSDTPYQHDMVGAYKMYFTNENDVIFNDRYYEPLLIGIPAITQRKTDSFWGVSITSQGSLSMGNADQGAGIGFFDNIYERYAWNNAPVTILWGGEDLPYSEYKKMFKGILFDKNLSTNIFDISFVDKKEKWQSVVPLNSYDQTAYPNLADDDVGKAIPWGWGTIKKQPVVCVTQALGTATNTHIFKIVDTSLNSITAIDQVYVGNIAVTHTSGSIAAATFKLATSTYTPGDEVTVDYQGYKSGTVVENPVIVTRQIGEQIGETYTSTTWNQTAINAAITEAEDFPVGVAITEFRPAINVVTDIIQSCLGTFYVDNDGLYALSIWSPDLVEDLDEVTEIDILEGTFKATSKNDDIKKTVKIGWNKQWYNNSYSYKQKSTAATERLYDNTRSRTIPTLLSTSAGATILMDRVSLITKNATINISFTTKLQLSLKNIADRMSISFKRIETGSNISWLNGKVIEIKEIVKDFLGNTLAIVADDLKGIGAEVGNWTADTITFPAELGGGSGTPWDSSWSAEKKVYAKNHWGYWTNDDGFADPTDSDSYLISLWW
jgi:hypothetical protein